MEKFTGCKVIEKFRAQIVNYKHITFINFLYKQQILLFFTFFYIYLYQGLKQLFGTQINNRIVSVKQYFCYAVTEISLSDSRTSAKYNTSSVIFTLFV